MPKVKTDEMVHENSSIDAPPYTILLVDDEKIVRMVAKRRLVQLNHRLLEAENGKEALKILHREPVDLILSDWMMPELDGPGLCEAVKGNERFRSIHFILMTALDQPAQLVEGLNRGADDFLPKSASEQEIMARVSAGIRARQLIHDLAESNSLLSQKQEQLDAELHSAAEFVRSLLPPPGEVVTGVKLEWTFLPSSQLGGDLFQVARWGDDHLGIMVLDMSGHGTGPALRAVSLAMLFKGDHIKQTFPNYDPGEIVTFLNRENPMTEQGDYFTIWVGVYQLSTRILRYASAGHPGSILVRTDSSSGVLGAQTWPIGFSPDEIYGTKTVPLSKGDRLYLFSDGIYEVENAEEELWGRKRLQKGLEAVAQQPIALGLESIIRESRTWQGRTVFGDDVALVALEFQG